MPRATYVNGDIYCSVCRVWVYKTEIPIKTHYSKGAGLSHYHNECNTKMRVGGKRTPAENREAARKQRLEYSGYGAIVISSYPRKGAGIKYDILSKLDKWEELVNPSYQHEENNNLIDYSYRSSSAGLASPISAINICTDTGKRPSRIANLGRQRYSNKSRPAERCLH